MGEKKVFWEIRDEEISDMFEEFKKTDNYSKLSDEQRSKLLEANKWFYEEHVTMQEIVDYLNLQLNEMLEEKQDAENAKEQSTTATKSPIQTASNHLASTGGEMALSTGAEQIPVQVQKPSNMQTTDNNSTNVGVLNKQFNITISTGNPKGDEAAMDRLSGFILEKLEDIKTQFAEAYKLTMNHTVE